MLYRSGRTGKTGRAGKYEGKVGRGERPICLAPLLRTLPSFPSFPSFPSLFKTKKLMRLQAEPPARVGQAIAKRRGGVGLPVRPIHGLEIKVLELQALVSAWLGAGL